MKSKKIVSLLLTGAMTAALLAVPAQAAEAPPIRVNSYKGSTLEAGERSGLIIGPSGAEYTVTSSAPDTPEEIRRQEQLRRYRVKSRERYQMIKAGEHAVGQPFKLTCKCCGKEFESKRTNTMFCGPNCRTKFYRQEAAENRSRECICENCGAAFTATRKNVKYCCDACRNEAHRKMQRERNAAKRAKKIA